MGSSNMNKWLTAWAKSKYKEVYRDLCTCFIKRGMSLAEDKGYEALITSDTCMYISSFERMRKMVIDRTTIVTFIDTRGTNAHPDVFDANAGWVLWNHHGENVLGAYFKLNHPITEKGERLLEALADPDCGWFYRATPKTFSTLPGSPITYWVASGFQSLCRSYQPLETEVSFKEGITTGDNDVYLRFWHEVSSAHFACSQKASKNAIRFWVPCNKGGSFRRWYGNNDYVIDWTNDGNDLASFPGSSFRNSSYQRNQGVSYSNLSSGRFAARYSPEGFAFESKGTTCFSNNLVSTLAYLNSSLFGEFAKLVCPTLDFKFGALQKLPDLRLEKCEDIGRVCVQLAKDDWDSSETSWDFKCHPLI